MKEIDLGKIKQARTFPPAFKPTQETIDKLVKRYHVHPQLDEIQENPDPADCEYCGMKYKDLRTGLDFQAVKDMLWVAIDDPQYWRHKRRNSVLGLWREIKLSLWDDHLVMCRDREKQEEWVEAFGQEAFEPVDYDEWADPADVPF